MFFSAQEGRRLGKPEVVYWHKLAVPLAPVVIGIAVAAAAAAVASLENQSHESGRGEHLLMA